MEERKKRVRFTGKQAAPVSIAGSLLTGQKLVRLSFLAVAFVFALIILGFKATSNPLARLSYEDQVAYLQQQGESGNNTLVEHLVRPGKDIITTMTYLKLVGGELNTDELRVALENAVSREEGDNCLVSLALCLMGSESGLPRFFRLIETCEFGSSKHIKANFFGPEYADKHPLQQHYEQPDDVRWAFAIIEDFLHHNFCAESLTEKKRVALEWWRDNSSKTMMEWQRGFLRSAETFNRTDAFDFILRKCWRQRDNIPMLIEAMKAEEDKPMRRIMACRLFKLGATDSLTEFNEFIKDAVSEQEISSILATITMSVALPNDFYSVDTWKSGRDDLKTFTWFKDWWTKNYDLMVFHEGKWQPIGAAASGKEENLFD